MESMKLGLRKIQTTTGGSADFALMLLLFSELLGAISFLSSF
ncbi:MAG: hypothetical protein ACFFBD_00485 [Candidatus Hodarchaeota archaeon]